MVQPTSTCIRRELSKKYQVTENGASTFRSLRLEIFKILKNSSFQLAGYDLML